MIYIIIWYLIGVIGSLYFTKKAFGKVTIKDLIVTLIIGGLLGPIGALIVYLFTDSSDKEIF